MKRYVEVVSHIYVWYNAPVTKSTLTMPVELAKHLARIVTVYLDTRIEDLRMRLALIGRANRICDI